MSAAVEAIIFDLSEVCLRGLKGTNQLLGAHLGLAIDDDAFLGEAAVRLFHGEISEEEYLRAIITANRWAVEVTDLKRLVRKNFERIEGTEAVVERLKAHGYRLGLLSVHAREWVQYCQQRYQHQRHFDAFVYSYDCAVSKPEPAAYERALAALDATPQRTVFIDDAEVNVRAAEAMGMRAIQFEDADQLSKRLTAMGVLPGESSGVVEHDPEARGR